MDKNIASMFLLLGSLSTGVIVHIQGAAWRSRLHW